MSWYALRKEQRDFIIIDSKYLWDTAHLLNSKHWVWYSYKV